jgi:hypothetical protein
VEPRMSKAKRHVDAPHTPTSDARVVRGVT